jgi:hypothetical protein
MKPLAVLSCIACFHAHPVERPYAPKVARTLGTSSALCVDEKAGPRSCAPTDLPRGTAHILWDIYARHIDQDSMRNVPCDSLGMTMEGSVANVTLCVGRSVTIEPGLPVAPLSATRMDAEGDGLGLLLPVKARWDSDLTVRMLAHDDAGGRLATLHDGSVQHVLSAWYVGDCCSRTRDGCVPAVVEVVHFCNPADLEESDDRLHLSAARQASEADDLHRDRSGQWHGVRHDRVFACQWYDLIYTV